MTDNELLQKLVNEGAGLQVLSIDYVTRLAAAEVKGNRILWVGQFAEDQHHAHVVKFHHTEQVGEIGLSFFDVDGKLLVYVTTYVEWDLPESYAINHAQWVSFLETPEAVRFWEFVEEIKQDYGWSENEVTA